MMEILQSPIERNHGVESKGEGGGKFVAGSSLFDYLSEDCISNIISSTSPRDACVLASVSKSFESAVKSGIVWEKFLPLEYESLFPRPRVFSSKKELYFTLCDDPILIDDGKQSFWLEKASGKRCIMLSARSISITWGDTPRYWQWIHLPEARFEEVAELRDVWWFGICGRTNTRLLSLAARYSAYIVFKKEYGCHGFKDVAVQAEVGVVGQEASRRFVCFDACTDVGRRNLVEPHEREDKWMEIELGEFFNQGGFIDSDEIEMSALETKGLSSKHGLIIQGIEIRPAKSQ